MTSDIILNTIAELNNVNDLHSIGDVLLNLLKISTDTTNMTNMGCRVGIYNKHTDEYITYFDSNHAHDTLFSELSLPSRNLNDIKYFSKQVINTYQTLVIQDSYSPEALSIDPRLQGEDRHAMIWIPLLYNSEFLGIISMGMQLINAITTDIIKYLEILAHIIAMKAHHEMRITEIRYDLINKVITEYSHNLYNHLTVIMGNVDLLEHNLKPLSPKILKYVDNITTSIVQSIEFIKDVKTKLGKL